jgi:hypothetical protein
MAKMGRAEAVKALLPGQLKYPDRAPIMDNRMDQREGPQTTSVQRLGRVADTLHHALVQNVGAGPAQDPVLHVFPAWPKDWDASFQLLVRGGFLVSASQRDGKIEFVEIESPLGGECRMRNPWGESRVSLFKNGTAWKEMDGKLLTIDTAKGDNILVAPGGTELGALKRKVNREVITRQAAL